MRSPDRKSRAHQPPWRVLWLLVTLMCWTNPKTGVKTDCRRCDCPKSDNAGNHVPIVTERGLIYCDKCLVTLH